MTRLSACLFGLAVVLPVACWAQESFLLTDNGLTNSKYSEYKDVSRLETGGTYEVNPPLESGPGGSVFSFADGALTNGDSSFDFKRDPGPYSYWHNMGRGELIVNLGRQCTIDRVRLCLLNREGGPHGTASVDVYVKGDALEFPDILKVGSIDEPVNGWNEFTVGRQTDGLRLVLKRAPGCAYITVSEVELWGTPIQGADPAPSVTSSDPQRTEEGITWWAFDFGPANSASFARFHVTDAKATYSPERGFGWIPYEDGRPVTESNFGPASAVVPGLGERNRDAALTDPLYRDLVMTSEYYHTQVRQTFAVDVPPGDYTVMTMHGDVSFGRPGKQNYWIEAEGQRVPGEISLPSSCTTDVVFDVGVQDGRLDLTFDGDSPDPASKGFAINGLVILPADTDEQRQFATRKIAKIRAAIQRYAKQAFEDSFTEVPYEETATMVTPSEADNARGFIAWTPQWMEMIYPHSVPTSEGVQRPCGIFATPGEYEPFVVAIRALRPLAAVTVELGDLAGEKMSIPAEAIDVRKVGYWRQRLGSSWSTEYRVMPELLEPFDTVKVAADTTQEFWLTVHVPEDVAPGRYAGPVIVKTDGEEMWQSTVTLEVLPFTLDKPERVVGMYWRDEKWEPERLDKQLQDMLAHGIGAVTLNRSPEVSNVDGKLVVDTSELLSVLQHLKQMGITGPIPYHGGLDRLISRNFPDGDFEQLYVEVIRQLEAVSSRDDTPKLLYYPVDEIGSSDERGEKAHRLCSLAAKVPGATSYITVNNYAGGEKWGDSFDIWCGNIEYTAEQEDRLLARGKRYMRYGSAYLNDSRQVRNSCGLGFYRRPAEAHYYWHYQAYNVDAFNDFDGNARDWCAAYPGPDGPIPTMDWEAIREGIDDLRYIATLNRLATDLEAGSNAQKQVAARARKELADILAMDDGVNQYTFAENLTHAEFDGLRRRLVDRILEMLGAQ